MVVLNNFKSLICFARPLSLFKCRYLSKLSNLTGVVISVNWFQTLNRISYSFGASFSFGLFIHWCVHIIFDNFSNFFIIFRTGSWNCLFTPPDYPGGICCISSVRNLLCIFKVTGLDITCNAISQCILFIIQQAQRHVVILYEKLLDSC